MYSPVAMIAAVSSRAICLRDGVMLREVSLMRLSGGLAGWRLPAYRQSRAHAARRRPGARVLPGAFRGRGFHPATVGVAPSARSIQVKAL